jgi:hypothetical protein
LNSLLSYVLIYIDLVVFGLNKDQNQGRRIILIAIGIYSTAYMSLKGILALFNTIYNIFKCNRSKCCRKEGDKERLDKVNSIWKALKD